ncbi:hypothetical protein [Prevotella nigrescens]|nr:hypothetical protein [Prevotella nigrescens]
MRPSLFVAGGVWEGSLCRPEVQLAAFGGVTESVRVGGMRCLG